MSESIADFRKGGDPYDIIKESGRQVEEDKKTHNVDHLTTVSDKTFGNVLKLEMHSQDGNGAGDNENRQRTEIKGSSKSPDGPLKAKKGDTVNYEMMWMPGNGLAHPNGGFFHVHQIKVVGDDDVDGHPAYTLSLRNTKLRWEDWYEDEDVVILDLKNFYDKWILFKMSIHYGENNAGWYKVTATDFESDEVIKKIERQGLDIWGNKKSGGKWDFVREKMGIYHEKGKRSKTDTVYYAYITTSYGEKSLILPETNNDDGDADTSASDDDDTETSKKLSRGVIIGLVIVIIIFVCILLMVKLII